MLKAYASHNPTVGYCQSLNFISGMMLLFLQEEDAFWLLLTVVDTLLPKDCYSRSMIGTHVDQLVLAKIIESSLPELHTYVFTCTWVLFSPFNITFERVNNCISLANMP